MYFQRLNFEHAHWTSESDMEEEWELGMDQARGTGRSCQRRDTKVRRWEELSNNSVGVEKRKNDVKLLGKINIKEEMTHVGQYFICIFSSVQFQ